MQIDSDTGIPRRSLFGRHATLVKMFGILALVLVLLIPLGMISSVQDERLMRRDQAIADITSSWGREQMIVGPVLVVPYRYSRKVLKEEIIDGRVERKEVLEPAVAKAYFLPAALAVDGAVETTERYRGIYRAVVYSGSLKLSGQFNPPDFESLKVEASNILWHDAVVTFAIPDLRGTRGALRLAWGENSFELTPGTPLSGFPSGIQAKIKDLRPGSEPLPFSLDLTLNGSGGIYFAPVGIQNTVKLTSPWPDPSYRGAFLPVERNELKPTGFEAKWQVSYYGRSYAQQWTDQEETPHFNLETVRASRFGVDFISLIDSYRNVERSIKYGILFITLVFTVFFLYEILSPLKIHPFQYTLVGAGLSLFYLTLLSFSEFMSFLSSYLIAATAIIAMISLYSLKVLKSGRRTLVITGLLAVIYGFLYVTLQLQDYSLLFGTIGLFITLAATMYVTRNVDWYARDQAS